MTYAEFLKSQGASEEEIKVMDTAVGRRAFDAMQRTATEAAEEAARQKASAESYQTRVDQWFEENKGKLDAANNNVVTAKAEAERARAAILAAHKQGMLDVAILNDLGIKPDGTSAAPPAAPPNPGAPNFDPNKYFTRDDILTIAEREGEAIAMAQDIAAEHSVLFPGRPLNFRELRREAVAAKKPLEQVWMDKFQVSAAREAKQKAEREAEQKKWMEEGAKAREAELLKTIGSNPFTRAPEASHSPFAPRPQSDTRSGKQPWEVGTSEQLSAQRVEKGAKLALERLARPN
jgi:hypothetical protein